MKAREGRVTQAVAEKLIDWINEQLDDGDTPTENDLTRLCHEAGYLAPEHSELRVLIQAVNMHRSKSRPVGQVIHRNPTFVLDDEWRDPFALDPTNLAGYAFKADEQIRSGITPKIQLDDRLPALHRSDVAAIRKIMRWREIVWGDYTNLIGAPGLVLARLLPGLVPG